MPTINTINPILHEVTQNIIQRSKEIRQRYLEHIDEALTQTVSRATLSCSNLAHGAASCEAHEKENMLNVNSENIAIISAYNDMLSAHEPYKTYPPLIKRTLLDLDLNAQFAGGVPAMCDGITQSQPGMELSLFSRDTIAMSSAIALSHNMFDGALYLGVCDKIVPGLLISALSFGHLPAVFIPAGPMSSGISNDVKAKIRQEYVKGNVTHEDMLKTEASSYHESGTCTFYGTANSNQMLMEIMGLHLPGSSFVPTNTLLREALTVAATEQLTKLTQSQETFMPIGKMIDEKSFVNAIVGLLATGGSTNHTIHLIAMARAAGIVLTWEDFDTLSKIIPLLCKMYPNGSADVNAFHNAGGMGILIQELLNAKLLHNDVNTMLGFGLEKYLQEPYLDANNELAFRPTLKESTNTNVLSSVQTPFSNQGGLSLLEGNLGQSIIKTSALKKEHLHIKAPARVFHSEEELNTAFKNGELHRDFIAVVRYQGPSANGMPELHGLMKPLGVLQDEGYKVGIITDGRMSGASGKVPSAIHVSPEAIKDGLIAKVENDDMVEINCNEGTFALLVDEKELAKRRIDTSKITLKSYGVGRELFATMRQGVSAANEGACTFALIH